MATPYPTAPRHLAPLVRQLCHRSPEEPARYRAGFFMPACRRDLTRKTGTFVHFLHDLPYSLC